MTVDGWSEIRLGDHAHIAGRIGWKGLKAEEYTDTGPYLIAGKHIRGTKIAWDECDHLSNHRYEESPEIQLEVGDVVISKDGTIGRVAWIDQLPGPATINSTMMLLRPDNNPLTGRYLQYFLQGRRFRIFLDERVSGSSVPHIFQKDMMTLVVATPPLPEQRKIAAILSSVDEVIEKTEAVIEQLQVVKKAMMQELLTRGLPGRHTRFKQTEIGEIPEEWEVVELPSIVRFQEGPGLRKWQFRDQGFPFVNIRCLVDGRLDLSNVRHIDEEEARVKYRHFWLDADDTLMSSSGTLGRIAVVRDTDLPLMLNTSVIRFRPHDEDVCTIDYMRCFMQGDWFLAQCVRESQGSAQANFGPSHLKKTVVALPDIEEQIRISEVIRSVDSVLEASQQERISLEATKQALMSVLLTGQVRVTPDEGSA